jgi:small GTP-binding protein
MGLFGKKPKKRRTGYKICVLGDPGVGKTSLIRRFTENRFDEDFKGQKQIFKADELYVSIVEKGLPRSDVITLNIWDLVDSVAMNQALINAKGALLVCDMSDRGTLYPVEYWKNELFDKSGEVPVIVVGNKIDVISENGMTEDNLKGMAGKLKAPYMMTSAKTGKNVEELFYSLAKMLL